MKPSVTRDICGTATGYRKHKYLGEEKCQSCKDAYNVERRTKFYSTEKNAQYKAKYQSKPEAKEKAREYAKEYAKAKTPPEVLEARLRKKQEALGTKWAKEIDTRLYEEQETLYREEKAQLELDGQKLLDSILATTKPVNELLRKVRKVNRAKEKAAERAKERKRLSEERKVQREREKERIKAEKRAAKEALNNQHGTSIGDYSRCKRRNKVACGPCLAIAAKYRRDQVAQDPERFKAQKKEYFKRYPDRKPSNSRDRARHKGVERSFYTREQIIKRDGINCYLCAQPLDFEATHVQGQPGWELYPHIEHVIPIAKGGSDTLDNVKLAHAKCNMDKGVRLLSEILE